MIAKGWYVYTEDGLWTLTGNGNPYATKAGALWDCTCAVDDGRKRAGAKWIGDGLYEYSYNGRTFWIVRHDAIEKHGLSHLL